MYQALVPAPGATRWIWPERAPALRFPPSERDPNAATTEAMNGSLHRSTLTEGDA